MKAWRHRSRLFIGLWVITGLVVLGINGYVLMSLLDEPLAGYSPGVRQADRGFRQYRQLIRDEAEKIYTGMELLVQRFSASVAKIDPLAPVDQKEASAPMEKKIKQPAFATVTLPVLTGICDQPIFFRPDTSDGHTGKRRLFRGPDAAGFHYPRNFR